MAGATLAARHAGAAQATTPMRPSRAGPPTRAFYVCRIIVEDAIVTIRDAEPGDVDRLASLWFEGWRDGHVAIVPAELTALRTRDSFLARLTPALAEVRVAGAREAPDGFYMLRESELYQFYVARAARGSGVAAALIADAEARLADRGVRTAWLMCAIGNDRAARFYEKCGWRRVATVVDTLSTTAGPFQLAVWRYEKVLGVS
jgi:ribosomal protein S18 acetylase RimI-like enzyme